MSNNPKDLTFIYGTNRVIYNAGGMFHGSPYHSPGYNSPVGNGCDYDLILPLDDPLLGETDINLFRPGNGGNDATAQDEIHGYWFASQFGLPFLYCRPVVVYANGARRGTAFLDAQQPNGDYVEQWFPDDPDGDLHKVQIGFEFGDLAYGNTEPGYATVGANLKRYTTTGGAKKQARYRQTWPRRAAPVQELHDYTNIFDLVEVVMTNAAVGTETYTPGACQRGGCRGVVQRPCDPASLQQLRQLLLRRRPERVCLQTATRHLKLFIWDNDSPSAGRPTTAGCLTLAAPITGRAMIIPPSPGSTGRRSSRRSTA